MRQNKLAKVRILAKQAYLQVHKPKILILACIIGIILCALYPSDLESYRTPPAESELPLVLFTEQHLRFLNTAVQIGLPILLKDKIGMAQLIYTGISTTLATHGIKRLANRWEVGGTRVGERPSGPGSRHNMPSGHSSMASCAACFVCRRYGIKHALYLIPILLLTMYARVALDSHTVSAVIAGALIGFLMTLIFTSKRKKPSSY